MTAGLNVKFGLFQSLSTNKNISRIILLIFSLIFQQPIPKLDFLIRYSFYRQKQFDGLKNCETLEFVVSELVVGSDEQDIYNTRYGIRIHFPKTCVAYK